MRGRLGSLIPLGLHMYRLAVIRLKAMMHIQLDSVHYCEESGLRALDIKSE